MPVAMAIGAKSMGLSVDKFIKKVSDGQVQSRDFIKGFATELRNSVRETGALEASLESVRTARARFMATFSLGVFEGFKEAGTGLKDFFTTLSKMVVDNLGGFRVLGEGIGLFFKILTMGLEVISPILFLFTRSLENVRLIFDNAFNIDKTADKLTALEKMLRLVGGIGMMALGGIIIGFEELQKVIDKLTGKEEGKGLSLLQQIFAGFLVGGLLGWLTKILGKFLGIKAAVGFISKVTGKGGQAAKASKGAGATSLASNLTTGDVGLGMVALAPGWGKVIGAALMAMEWVDQNSAGYNKAVFNTDKTSSQMFGDMFAAMGDSYSSNIAGRRATGFNPATNVVVNNQMYLRTDITGEEAMEELANKIKEQL